MEHHGNATNGFGVRTAAQSFCSWMVSPSAVELHLDTNCGSNGVRLGTRTLHAAEIVTMKGKEGEPAFQSTRRFAKLMCDKARMPKEPVYGINDWYFTYGNNSEKLILEHTDLMSPFAEGSQNLPFSVIDAGWFQTSPQSPEDRSWGDMRLSNNFFGDMSGLAAKIKVKGMRPGLWTRPLCGGDKDAKSLMLPATKGRDERSPVLDPSIPENIERVTSSFELYRSWGYELVKFDYTSFDVFGKWGFQMLRDKQMTAAGWSMNDAIKNERRNYFEFLSRHQEGGG